MTIQNDLKALQKELAKLNNQTERLQARLVKLEKRVRIREAKPSWSDAALIEAELASRE